MISMNDIAVNSNSGGNFYLLLGDFLDEFYKSDNNCRLNMIVEPPEDICIPELLPFLAAAAHKLANDCGMEAPGWTFEPRCYLPGDKPFFGCGAKGNLRLLFMYKSPPEFKHRNLFVDENVLVRV